MVKFTVLSPPLERGASCVMPEPLVKEVGQEADGISHRSWVDVHENLREPPTGTVSEYWFPFAGTTQLTVFEPAVGRGFRLVADNVGEISL